MHHDPAATGPIHPDLQAARQGDGAAFTRLYDTHARRIRAVARRWSAGEDAAEDLVQEVFARLLESETRLPSSRAIRSWCLVVGRRAAISAHRRHRTAQALLPHVVPLPPPSNPMRDAELRMMVAQVLHDLRARDAALVTEHYLEGLTLEEMARRRGTSRDVVKVQLHRARVQARASARRHDIDGLPGALPGPLASLGAMLQTAVSSGSTKLALGAAVPLLIIGGLVAPGLSPFSAPPAGEAAGRSSAGSPATVIATSADGSVTAGLRPSPASTSAPTDAPTVATAPPTAAPAAENGRDGGVADLPDFTATVPETSHGVSGQQAEDPEGTHVIHIGPAHPLFGGSAPAEVRDDPRSPVPEGPAFRAACDAMTDDASQPTHCVRN